MQFVGVGTFRAEMASRYGRLWIALDRNQLSILVINQLPATNGAVGANGPRHVGAIILRAQVARPLCHGFRAVPIRPGSNLL